MSVQELSQKILDVVKNDNFNVETLKQLLDPVPVYSSNPNFVDNIKKIVTILLQDRDNNGQFNLDDLVLLGKDIGAIMSLVTAIILFIAAIPGLKLQYDADKTEEIIFKVLSYIFLVVVPQQLNRTLTYDEKKTVVNITIQIYNVIKSSEVVKQLVAKIVAWFKTKCSCTKPQDAVNQAVVEKRLPKINLQLQHSYENIKEKSNMQQKIRSLEKQLDKNKSKSK